MQFGALICFFIQSSAKSFCYLMSVFIMFGNYAYGQGHSKYNIDTVWVNEDFNRAIFPESNTTDSVFYEDNDYVFNASCSGEWGGSLYVQDKATGKRYECSATCPVSINKIDSAYYLTTTLAHGICFAEVLKISDPKKLKAIENKPSGKRKTVIKSISDLECKSKVGLVSLVDTMGVLILMSYIQNGRLLHITTDHVNTYLAEIRGTNLVNLRTICDKSIWCYNPKPYISEDGSNILLFKNSKVRGYLSVDSDSITLYFYN